MVFDDYGGGWEQEKHLQVKTAVDSFISAYEKDINVISIGYQFIIQKINYENNSDFTANYYKL
jgi:hypothetical protein